MAINNHLSRRENKKNTLKFIKRLKGFKKCYKFLNKQQYHTVSMS